MKADDIGKPLPADSRRHVVEGDARGLHCSLDSVDDERNLSDEVPESGVRVQEPMCNHG